jgi:hypothetical protein
MIVHTYPPVKMEPTECSETSAFNFQTPGKYPEENLLFLKYIKIYIKIAVKRDNLHFNIVLRQLFVHSLVNKNFDSIKMHGTNVKIKNKNRLRYF